jgi:SAM-dependent methyltransferase/tetratricopeptide (TPR) repeat protein
VASADYDHRAFDSPIPLQRYWQRARHQIVLDFLSLASGQGYHTVLDIGCGSSRIIQELPKAVGMDILLPKLRFLRNRHSRLVQGSIFALPFSTHTVDAVVCSEVIEHIPDNPAFFEEMGRVLRPGGTLILGTPDYGRWLWWLLEWIYGKVLPGAYAHEHITHYTRANLTERLTTFGYTIEDLKYVGRCEMIFRARKPGESLKSANPPVSRDDSTLTAEVDAIPKLPSVDPSSIRPVQSVVLQVGPWTMILVLLLTATVYVGSLGNQFIWDDVLMVVQNPKLRDLRNVPEFLRADFTTLTSGAIEGHYFRPTLAITLALDATLWGLNPAGFHLTNVLLHVLVTFLVSRLILAMGATRGVAVLAALIFGIYPVHVEAVAWIAGRQELLLSIGIIGCILAYRRWKGPGRSRLLSEMAALVFLAMALLSKESAVALPALLVLSDLAVPLPACPSRGPALWGFALRHSLPYWFVTIIFAIFRLPTLRHIGGDQLHPAVLWQRLPGALETLVRYVWLLLVPTHMQPVYALSRPTSFLDPWGVLGVVLGALLFILLLCWRHWLPLAFFGIGWFLITVAPVVDLVPFSLREMGLTDRYLYLPSVGISLLLALGITTLMGPAGDWGIRPRRLAGWAAVIVLLAMYPWSLLRYTPVWRNDLTLYGRMVQSAPASPMANFNFGFALLRANDLPGGTAALERAVVLDPRLPRPRAILALAYVLQGRTDDGFRIFDALGSEGRTEREYFASRTVAHLFTGDWQEALAVAEDGTHRFPDDADLMQWLGNALEKAGRPNEAVEKYRQALALRPDLFQVEEALGHLLVRSGRLDEAIQHFLQSAEIRPDRPQPIRALALLQEAQGNRSESLRLWRRVLELAPNEAAIREAVSHILRLEKGDVDPGASLDISRALRATGS